MWIGMRTRKEEWIREGKKEGKGFQINTPNFHKKTDWHVEEKCHKTAEKKGLDVCDAHQ